MKPWTFLDEALMPDGGTISLTRRDNTYSVGINGLELMSTSRHLSEDKIAELACAHVARTPGAKVLIGGLGFGFTLKAALAALPRDASITQVELLAAVVAWNRNPNYPLASRALNDPRVTVVQEDVAEVLRQSPGCFDSIILDVDNGPAAFSTAHNDELYGPGGLQLARQALRPGGCVAYWSAFSSGPFEKRMAKAGFRVEVQRCRAHPSGGGWHTIFLGRI